MYLSLSIHIYIYIYIYTSTGISISMNSSITVHARLITSCVRTKSGVCLDLQRVKGRNANTSNGVGLYWSTLCERLSGTFWVALVV